MKWTEVHTDILARAFNKILGAPQPGTMAFVRCLTPDMVRKLINDSSFALEGWEIRRVADANNEETRTITADRAVEMREMKADATLLLVDTERAGAGMDGIYSATREVDEKSLFGEALQLAKSGIRSKLSAKERRYAESAIRKAQVRGLRSVSPEVQLDFLCQTIATTEHPGAYLHLLGLWPVKRESANPRTADDELTESRMFVDNLLETPVANLTPIRRIEALRLLHPSREQSTDLEYFLRSASTKPLLSALLELADKQHLWINSLRIEGAAQSIQGIELLPWRTGRGKIAKWSGLVESKDPEGPPELILDPEFEQNRNYAKLEIKWKIRPANLEENAAQYNVVIMTDMGEEISTQDVLHSAKKEEKCRFSNDDFSTLSEDSRIPAKVVVSVIGEPEVEPQESEDFFIRFGQPIISEQGGVGKNVRTFSEGLIELKERDMVSDIASSNDRLATDSKGFVLLRTPHRAKSFRVAQPALIKEIEDRWGIEESNSLGRWRVKVRASGTQAGQVEFERFPLPKHSPVKKLWRRTMLVSRKMAERFFNRSGVGQIYDEKSKAFDTEVKQYLLAWAALLDTGNPELALANTVEVQSLSGRTIGLIVLPSHPLRVAWHAAYDNLVLHTAFNQGMESKDVQKEFSSLDGAMFPAFLPGLKAGSSFVFADMLGFHAVGMVPDSSKEPKAAVALLARALGGGKMADATPTVGEQSTKVLGKEILKYLECHNTSRLLKVHALRAADGFTIVRSLGLVHKHYIDTSTDEELGEDTQQEPPVFVLELYPSTEQRAIAGRFIAEAQEKRRSRAGVVSSDDLWMLESLSLPGNINLPKLRWARKDKQNPDVAAHLAVAFDTFESHVTTQDTLQANPSRPFYTFGLLSFFDRKYTDSPSPLWNSTISTSNEGEKHPSDRTHTERLVRLQELIQKLVARNIGSRKTSPVLRTEISPQKADSLKTLHQQCDWVITLDRNAGIEYFDSPRNNKEIYDAYVIDCVPEREDLGCLQLITSTSNLEEVRNLLDDALDQMGLSRSRQKAEFLFTHLKALSGRLAIRFTGQKAPTSELIALALCHANCCKTAINDNCWVSLEEGFFVPIDDILDLLPDSVAGGNADKRTKSRSDLIYVSATRKGLSFRFVEVKYRRYLRTARTPAILNRIRDQVESFRKRWDKWYSHENLCESFRAIRRAKLARVLRFYADKAHRHNLPENKYKVISDEIDRMIRVGTGYSFANTQKADRGWVFCPEYAGATPSEISPSGWDTRIFLFGPSLIPDSGFYPEDTVLSSEEDPEPGTQEVVPTPEDKQTSEIENSEEEPKPLVNQTPSITLGTDTFSGDSVSWQLTVKGNPHLLLAGLPGMGKTTCLLNICQQMLSADIRPIIFSYHLDIDEKLKELVPSVRFIDFDGLGFNPLQVIDRESPKAYLDVAGALRDIFTAIFPELGDIQGECIRKAIRDSFVELGWDNAAGEEIEEPEFRRFVEILRDEPKPDRGLKTLLARLGELEDYGFFDLRESHGSLWESEQPTIIRIHETHNDNLQKAFASLVFYGIYKDMFKRGTRDRVTHAVIFDEAHRAAGMKLIPTMAKECRKFGISLVLASQEAKDFNASVFSAIANYLVLRLTEADAKILIRNVAGSQQERVLIDKVKQMEKFRAFFFRQDKQRPYSVSLSPSE